MRLVSINVGRPRIVLHDGQPLSTGIFKTPIAGPVAVVRHNVQGDAQADLSAHGGPDKAVYACPFEHYSTWAHELNRDDLAPGQFGENLTVEGLFEDRVCVGDTFRIGSTELQVSQPRAPCRKLGLKMGDATFPARFLKSGRVGFYLRVVREGIIDTGDEIVRLSTQNGGMSVTELSRLRYFERDDVDGARRALNLPALAESWREEFRRRLA